MRDVLIILPFLTLAFAIMCGFAAVHVHANLKG